MTMNALDRISAAIILCIAGYFLAWLAIAEWLAAGQNNGIKHYRAY